MKSRSFSAFLILCFLAFCGVKLRAQEFGGNPANTSWKQVNNRAARVIFPAGLDSVARNVAGIAADLDGKANRSIGSKRKKIDIVLQNETTESNGYVSLGPFRSEFFLTPPQNSFELGSLPSYKQLAIHEFRHVQQFNNFDTGISRLVHIIFGQQGQALANSLVIPDWFHEGDAVYNETSVSEQGRGRLPYFFKDYRALWSEGKKYDWMKLRNGSYRDFVPDRYRLGYLQVAYGREKYGEEFWRRVTADAAAYRGLVYPFQQAIKRYSGLPFRKFRADALEYFKNQHAETKTAAVKPPARKHYYLNEEYPAVIDDSTLIYVESSYKKIPAFTIRKGQEVLRLKVKDPSIDRHFSYRNGRVVYSAFRPDLRWGWKNYGVIRLLNVTNGKQQTLTHRTKYFSPDISFNSRQIVAVEQAASGRSSLHLIDAATGKTTRKLPNPENYVYAYPKFADADRIVSVVKNETGTMSLALTHLSTGKTATLLPFSFHVMGFPVVKADTVYFTASTGAFDRIYACLLSNRRLFLIENPGDSAMTGEYQPAVSNSRLHLSRFTSEGYRLHSTSLDKLRWLEIDPSTLQQPLPDFGINGLRKDGLAVPDSSAELTVTNYPKTKGLINFHSLQPLIDDPVYAVSIIGENILNTMQSELALSYNRNEGYKRAGFNATYGGWFPFLSGGVTYTQDRRSIYRNNRIYWNEWEWRLGTSVPLNFSRGNHFTYLTAGVDYIYSQPRFQGPYKDTLGDRSFGYANTSLRFTNQIQRARQQINPRFGQTIILSYRKAISNGEASQFLASGYLFLPGLSGNHSLVLNAAFQQHDTLNQRSFSNAFPFSRGYIAENLPNMLKFGATYHFPLFYPDAGVANIVYLFRVRAAVFYDHTEARDARRNRGYFRSSGAEIYFDTQWWNQLPVNFGFRISSLRDRDLFGGSGRSRFEFILPLNILNR